MEWSVGHPTARAPGGRPARLAALQMPTDASEQNNTGPLGGPVIRQEIHGDLVDLVHS